MQIGREMLPPHLFIKQRNVEHRTSSVERRILIVTLRVRMPFSTLGVGAFSVPRLHTASRDAARWRVIFRAERENRQRGVFPQNDFSHSRVAGRQHAGNVGGRRPPLQERGSRWLVNGLRQSTISDGRPARELLAVKQSRSKLVPVRPRFKRPGSISNRRVLSRVLEPHPIPAGAERQIAPLGRASVFSFRHLLCLTGISCGSFFIWPWALSVPARLVLNCQWTVDSCRLSVDPGRCSTDN